MYAEHKLLKIYGFKRIIQHIHPKTDEFYKFI